MRYLRRFFVYSSNGLRYEQLITKAAFAHSKYAQSERNGCASGLLSASGGPPYKAIRIGANRVGAIRIKCVKQDWHAASECLYDDLRHLGTGWQTVNERYEPMVVEVQHLVVPDWTSKPPTLFLGASFRLKGIICRST